MTIDINMQYDTDGSITGYIDIHKKGCNKRKLFSSDTLLKVAHFIDADIRRNEELNKFIKETENAEG